MRIQTTKIYNIVEQARANRYITLSAQGATRSGKTRNIMIWLVVQCVMRSNIVVSVVRKTRPALKQSVFRDFKEVMLQLGLWSSKEYNKTDMVYTFPNGSIMEFFPADDEQKLRGGSRNILFVNEGNSLDFTEWEQLQLRCREFSIIDYNPSFSDEHWLCGLNREKDTFHFITTYKDNPFLEQRVINEIESLRHKNASLWRIYGLGLQAIVEGLVFPNIEIIDEIPENVKERCFIGMDFGYTNDPTAIVRMYINNDQLYIEELCYRTEMLASDIIRELKSKCKNERIISESADKRLVDEIYNAGLDIVPVHKYSGSIEAGVTKMKEFRIIVTKDSYNVIKEFKNYTYLQDKEGKWTNKCIDAYNHAIDAIRYIILTEVLGKEKNASAERILGYF